MCYSVYLYCQNAYNYDLRGREKEVYCQNAYNYDLRGREKEVSSGPPIFGQTRYFISLLNQIKDSPTYQTK
jgi:hypothetical protein